MTIQGMDKLRAKLRALPDAAKAEIRIALEAGAEDVVQMAKRLVPAKSGALRNSIGWTFGQAPKGSMVLGEAGESDLRVIVYAGNDKAFYARWVEFGTAKNRARPYFFPAYRAQKRRIKSRLTRATTKAARKVAAGGE